MQKISDSPFSMTLRLSDAGWEVLTPPGPQVQLLHRLSGKADTGIPVKEIDGFAMAVIPYTNALDAALQALVDTFISLRYATGRVQLELFTAEEV